MEDKGSFYIYNRENGCFVVDFKQSRKRGAKAGELYVWYSVGLYRAKAYVNDGCAMKKAALINRGLGRLACVAVTRARAKQLQKMEDAYRAIKARWAADGGATDEKAEVRDL